MKQYGIITFHRTTNFGSCLQAYALCAAVEQLGYNCELIDYRCSAIESREGVASKYSLTPKDILRRIIYQPRIERKYRSLMDFLKKHVKLSAPYTPQTIQQSNAVYDKFIVGSDIVWGVDITNNDYNYFLEFVESPKKKYAFSSSVGNHNVENTDPKVSQLLRSFRQIAVREQPAVSWVQQVAGKDASWVCDPTMLLTAEQWDAVVEPKQYQEDYVLVYFQDDNGKCIRDAKQYALAHGLRVVHVTRAIKPQKGIHKKDPTSLQEFLGLIRNAKFVFTASYHGMLFSLYYHKEFVFYTRAHSDRVLSLAQRLGIEGNCADKMEIEQYQAVDYAKVEEKMHAFRKESQAVLLEMLHS